MGRDLLTLARLEVRRLARQAAYWLRLFGVEKDDSTLYKAYAVGFWVFWAFAMWAFLLEQVELLSTQIPAEDAAALLDALPVMVLIAQVVATLALCLNPPLKLAAPDLAYVAPSPASRGAIALVRFVAAMLVPALGAAVIGSFVALLFAWRLVAPSVALAGTRGFALALGLVAVTGALGWTAALARQNRRAALARHAFWLIAPAALLGAWRLPGVFLWPGRVWTDAIFAAPRQEDSLLLVVGLAVALVALYAAGSRVHMAQVIDHSQMYARIRRLGVWGSFLAGDVITRLRAQSRLAKKRRLRGSLPSTNSVPGTLLGQSVLIVRRLSPGILLRLVGGGAATTSIAISLVRLGGTSAVQTWALLFVILMQLRPRDALHVYQTPLQRPFLRPFLPQNNLLLFAGQAAIPLLIMGVGAGVAALAQPFIAPAVALPLTAAALLALAMGQALESVRFRLDVPRLRYEYAVLVCGALTVISGHALGSVWAALLALVLLDAGLALLLHRSLPG